MSNLGPDLKMHPIQLKDLGVTELTFKSERRPASINYDDFGDPSFEVGRSPFDPSDNTILIFIRFSYGKPEDLFEMRIELVGEFKIDTTVFPSDNIEKWADSAAFYVLHPYLREHVYALTSRVGLKPMMLPLVQLPSFKVAPLKPKEEDCPDPPSF